MQNIENKVMIQILNTLIDVAEMNSLLALQHQYVNKQEFEKAVEVRNRVVELQKRLPTSDQLKIMRDELQTNKENVGNIQTI